MKNTTKQLLALALLIFLITASPLFSQNENAHKNKPITLKHWMTPEEAKLKHLIGINKMVTDPPPGPVTNLAEFDKVQSVLIRYSFGISYDLIAEMSQKCKVTTIVASNSEKTYVTNQYQNQGVNVANCDFLIAPSDSYWTRDYGPWFVIDGNNEFGIVDFTYNRPRPNDNAIPAKVAQMLGINLFEMDIETAGGNYMTDGMGMSASSDLIWVENPGYTHPQIAQIFEDYLGIETYHVLDDPNNTYIDHIDCWGKYLDVDKVLIRSVPTTHPQYDELEATAAYFAGQNSSFGMPYQVFRVYTPNDQPYTNSLILNNRVFVPIMNSQWDDEAIASYQEAMPGYEILGFTGDWESTDALHCRTMGIADIDQVHIRHIPILGEQPIQGSFPLQAEIHAFSGQPLNNDSVMIFYRINGAPWQTIGLTQGSGNNWSGSIPGATAGSQIDYYLFAADVAGNRMTHPLIGEPDPHTFFIGSQAFAQIAVSPEEINITAPVGQTAYALMNISNAGNLELNVQLSANTAVYDQISQSVSNSPSAGSYENNTYEELGWTDIDITNSGEIAGVAVTFTWSTDNWPEDGSFLLESPSGTTTNIASGLTSGTYTIDMTDFNGEELNGTWKMWIEDTYGDGGHQATDITMVISRIVSEEPWIGIGLGTFFTVQPGQNQSISIPCSAANLSAGMHEGTITIASNDPDNPVIDVPVHFDVTMTDDITVSPDTLWFLTLEDMMYGKMLEINNFTSSEIDITDITAYGSFVPWMFEQPLPQMPYSLPAGAELSLKVIVAIPPDSRINMIYDNLIVTSEIGQHTVVVAWDSDIITYNLEMNPDTLFFETSAQAWVEGLQLNIENIGNLPVFIDNIPEGGDYWIIPELPVTFPYTLDAGATLELTVFVSVIPVADGYIYDFIPIITQLGEHQVIVAINEDLLTDIDENGNQNPGNVFPNPFTDGLSVIVEQNPKENARISVLDIQGKRVRELHTLPSKSLANVVNWDVKDEQGKIVKNGIYFIKVETNLSIKLYKVIKKQ